MMARQPMVEGFLRCLEEALANRDLGPDGLSAIGKVFRALATVGSPGTGQAGRCPVCDRWLPPALETARRSSPDLARLVDSFAALESSLGWAPRASGGPHSSANWPDSHANAMIVGPGGIESRSDLQIGVSDMAPHVRYPDHSHPPEEVYLLLSTGRFQHGESAWFEPGIGGTFHNEPGIRHAMQSDDEPLFAIWLLPVIPLEVKPC